MSCRGAGAVSDVSHFSGAVLPQTVIGAGSADALTIRENVAAYSFLVFVRPNVLVLPRNESDFMCSRMVSETVATPIYQINST